jgi:hypothetical protein
MGNLFNKGEVKMNRITLGKKGLGEIMPINHMKAFNKGVDYFTEIVLFYGLMFGICFYGLWGAHLSSIKAEENL